MDSNERLDQSMPKFPWSKDHGEQVPEVTVPVPTSPFPSAATAAPAAPTAPAASAAPGGIVFAKAGAETQASTGSRIQFRKGPADTEQDFTVVCRWFRKDYDLYALVEYTDGHVEVVSCFGTTQNPRGFSTRTKDGAVVHVSGDQATSDSGARGDDAPEEVLYVKLHPGIRTVLPVVYSAKNSGTGSFHKYHVSTYVAEGRFHTVPTSGTRVTIRDTEASRNEHVYTLVPAVIHNGPQGAVVESVALYSRPGSELRPTVHNGVVTMDSGPENASKPRPGEY